MITGGRPVAATGALLAAALLLGGCGGGDDAGIRTAAVGRATVAEVVEAPGTVVARANATVTAPATGTVASLKVADGQRVKAGTVLLRVDSPQAEQALRQAREADREAADAGDIRIPRAGLTPPDTSAARDAFASARAAAAAIPDPDARARALAAAASAESQFLAAQAQAQQAVDSFNAGLGSLGTALQSLSAAQRVQTRAAVTAAQATVDALTVRAPITGVVTVGAQAASSGSDLSGALSSLPESLQGAASSALGGAGGAGGATVSGALSVGAPVQSGQQLLTVTDTGGLTVQASVDETDVLLVDPGVTADIELDAVPGTAYRGTVRSVDVSPDDSGTGNVSYLVRLSLQAGTAQDGSTVATPKPGMSAVVRLNVRTARDAVAVPASAVFHSGDQEAVWQVRDGRAEKRVVRVGAEGEDLVQITAGLTPGDRVVVAGADKVDPGQQVP